MWWSLIAGQALAFSPPNSTLGVSGGIPWLVGGRGEAWLADELSAELGGGTSGEVGSGFGVDAAIRWRPDALCFGCEYRTLASFGIGIGGTVVPPLDLEGSWAFAVGPDLALTVVYWLGQSYGLALSARGGAGPGWKDEDFGELGLQRWAFGTIGLAF